MRIIHIIPNLKKGGAERLVLDICNELTKRNNISVKLITFSPDNEYQFLTENLDWNIIDVSVQLSLVRKNSIEVANLQKILDDFKPDIIHTHLLEAEIISRSCYYPYAKWFTHCHSNMKVFNKNIKNLKRNIINKFERNYLFNNYVKNGGTHFISISKSTHNYFKNKIKNYTISLLPNAINYSFFFDANEKLISEPLILINIGSIKPIKNQGFLIEVMNFLKYQKINFTLYILGDGIGKEDLQKKIIDYNLEKEVVLLGNVDNVPLYLKQSHIYVHSCLSEALGLTLIEAMASGLPVITLDGGGNRDLIINGKNGYIFKNADHKLFAEKIISLSTDFELYKNISNYSKNFAEQFDIKDYICKLLNIYNKN